MDERDTHSEERMKDILLNHSRVREALRERAELMPVGWTTR